MSGNRYTRRGARSPGEPKIGRMFLLSLGLHLVLFLVFSGVLIFQGERDRRPVYYVDLTKMPVANPQAGRPDARPKTTKKKKPAKKTVKKPVKKAVVTKPKSQPKPLKVDSDAEIQKKLKAMQDKQQRRNEMEALKQQLAALAAGDTRSEDDLGSEAPLGEPDAQGDEAGISELRWLKAYIKQNWSLSQYQVRRTDLEATVWVIYSSSGRLVDFSLQKESEESRFNESIKKAILKSKQLEFEPGFANQKVTITFNLKDLLDR
jgi:hypothetical protein